MLNIGFDIRPALFDYAGIGRYVRELATAITQLPEEEAVFLQLFAPSWRGGRRIPPGLAEDRHKMNRGWLPGRVMDRLHKLPGLDAGRMPAKVDAFHYTDYNYPSVRTAGRLLTLHDAAFVAEPKFHGWDTSVLVDRVRDNIQNAHEVLVVSDPGIRDAELLGAKRDSIHVIPHGVSPFFKPSTEVCTTAGYLLTVGTLEPRKNYRRTLKALEYCWDRDLAPDWVIVGRPGWGYEKFVSEMRNSRHAHRIKWVQHLTDTELLRYYQDAMALLFPSLNEGFGLVVLESMACGTPAIIGNNTAPAWVAGNSGLRVEATEVDSIAAGIERMVSESAWRCQASAVAVQRAAEFTWRETARKTVAAYRRASEAYTAENS
ncbi:MAG: glycosyltransferase involved in cell wall biosynthesis [Myxococcota bacterium]|jgi:glycosyltransferase involved in cell wall biosynthesis